MASIDLRLLVQKLEQAGYRVGDYLTTPGLIEAAMLARKAGDPPDLRTRRRIENRFVSALEDYYDNQFGRIRAVLEANR